MKKTILLLSIISFSIFSCKNESNNDTSPKFKRDTAKAVIMTLGYGLKNVVGPVVAHRITVDTLMWVEKDTAHAEKKWNTLKYYTVYLDVMTDKDVAAKYGIKEFDSTGKHYPIIVRENYSPTIVKDSITSFDSAFSQLQRLIDTTKIK